MRLSKRKALEICIELWSWLGSTGSAYKEEWPGWKMPKIFHPIFYPQHASFQNLHPGKNNQEDNKELSSSMFFR